nr:MAG TPA: hypothetical protein [Caudoviricetes sp.]
MNLENVRYYEVMYDLIRDGVRVMEYKVPKVTY